MAGPFHRQQRPLPVSPHACRQCFPDWSPRALPREALEPQAHAPGAPVGQWAVLPTPCEHPAVHRPTPTACSVTVQTTGYRGDFVPGEITCGKGCPEYLFVSKLINLHFRLLMNQSVVMLRCLEMDSSLLRESGSRGITVLGGFLTFLVWPTAGAHSKPPQLKAALVRRRPLGCCCGPPRCDPVRVGEVPALSAWQAVSHFFCMFKTIHRSF